jgi:hypothetical protein
LTLPFAAGKSRCTPQSDARIAARLSLTCAWLS